MNPIKAFVGLVILALVSYEGGLEAGALALAYEAITNVAINQIGLVSAILAIVVGVLLAVKSAKESAEEILSIHSISGFVAWLAFSVGMITVGASPV